MISCGMNVSVNTFLVSSFWSMTTPCKGEVWHPSGGNQFLVCKKKLFQLKILSYSSFTLTCFELFSSIIFFVRFQIFLVLFKKHQAYTLRFIDQRLYQANCQTLVLSHGVFLRKKDHIGIPAEQP